MGFRKPWAEEKEENQYIEQGGDKAVGQGFRKPKKQKNKKNKKTKTNKKPKWGSGRVGVAGRVSGAMVM